MSAADSAHSKIVTLLTNYSPSATWINVYSTHNKANLIIPALSVEVDTDTPIDGDEAILQSELIDNRNIILSIFIHSGYRLGYKNTGQARLMTDEAIRQIRENIDLGDGYRVFDVIGAAYDTAHEVSGTTGAEIKISIHKVENYVQD